MKEAIVLQHHILIIVHVRAPCEIIYIRMQRQTLHASFMFEFQTEGWHRVYSYIFNISLFLLFPDREKPNKIYSRFSTTNDNNTDSIVFFGPNNIIRFLL